MENFIFYSPTKVYFGKGREESVGTILRDYGATKVMVMYGGGSARKSGLLDRVEASLRTEGLPYVLYGGVHANPLVSHTRKAIQTARDEGIDFILAVGGGSVIDEAKATGIGCYYPGDVWDFYEKKATPTKTVPVGSILTIAAAGSETSRSSVLTNEEGGLKFGYSSDLIRPVFTIMNPELLYTLPPYQMACGIVDMIMHVVERFFSPHAEDDLTDHLAGAFIRSVMKNAHIVKDHKTDYNANFQLMWAGSLAHNGLFEGGNGHGDWGTHHIEMAVSGLFDVAHGAGLAALWPSWARYVLHKDPARFAKLSRLVFKTKEEDANQAARLGIDQMEAFFRHMDMPVTLRELGIAPTDDQYWEMANTCTKNDTKREGVFGELTAQDIYNIYKMAEK